LLLYELSTPVKLESRMLANSLAEHFQAVMSDMAMPDMPLILQLNTDPAPADVPCLIEHQARACRLKQ